MFLIVHFLAAVTYTRVRLIVRRKLYVIIIIIIILVFSYLYDNHKMFYHKNCKVLQVSVPAHTSSLLIYCI